MKKQLILACIFALSSAQASNLLPFDRLNSANISINAYSFGSTLKVQLSPITKLSPAVTIDLFRIEGAGEKVRLKRVSQHRCLGTKDNLLTFDIRDLNLHRWIVWAHKDDRIIGFHTSPSSLERMVPIVEPPQRK